ncbi:non-ribosomal peptide synthase/polyketide synthase [Rhodococcus sp. BP-324]|uniref:non-ribosomal peptide synthase/polyketide synthase n=1 Tax=Rhodococcus sp. BP-324 TaxID=2739503 RepID=UPI001C9AA099|nr:non-ribosomal peptide synthase/polyketide synthase [Rhodococcus sp. BP-324]MBY6420361.1 non-ribosomal peptide synthase/polyketide synthase [Rhodococcus sp. BP-324]
MSSRSSKESPSTRTDGTREKRTPRTRKPRRTRATLLPALLATAVERDPSAVALVDGDRTVTYAELDTRSSTLARALIADGAGPESIVAVALTRSLESITAIWAVIKSGAAFLPVDPSYPAERIRHLLTDSGASLGVTVGIHRDVLPSSCTWSVLDDDAFVRRLEQYSGDPVSTADKTGTLRATNPAYVIYTSGSTGTPKGVVVSHAGLADLCGHSVRTLGVTAESRTLHFTSPSFDVSIFDYLIAIGSGATMVIAPPDNYGGAELKDLLKRERVTHGFSTPAALTSIDGDGLPDLQALVVGGEAFGADLVARWAPGRAVFNGYGPTEATIFATMSSALVVGERIPLGDPVDGMRAYVLDTRLSPVPPGVAGELYLAGGGVARGYHGRLALTSERFVADPHDPAGGRMYRTGDVVRRDASGALEYMGRNDFQVKIRGFRIELGEIDAALATHPDVEFALTMGSDAGAGGTALVSYALVAEGSSADSAALLAWLRESLPKHMVPSAMMLIDHVPLTGAGKVDRSKLPAPAFESREYRAPSTPTEDAVAAVFGELLSRDTVGADDDFFELGGNSLIGTQVAARVGARLHKRVPARLLFDAPSVSALAAAIDNQADVGQRVELGARERPERIPLSLAQQRMWFLNRFDPTSSAYNIPVAVRLSGALDTDALTAAVTDVVERHETLRTIYPSDEQGPHQVVLTATDASVALERRRTTESDVTADVLASIDTAFDVETEVPLRISLFALSETEHVLVVVVHHIAADGSSVVPLTRDVMIAYSARTQGTAPQWTPLDVQYVDYTLWQRDTLGDAKDPTSTAYTQIEFWKSELAGIPDQLDLPFDRPRPPVQSLAGGEIPLELDADLHAALTETARASNASLFMIMHAAWAVTLSRLSQCGDIAVGSPIAGRGEAQLDDLIGMFANTIVFRTHVRWGDKFETFLRSVRDTDLEAFAHADVPFETLVDALETVRSTARHPLFQVGLSFQNIARTALELPDLTVTGLDADGGVSKFDLHLVVSDTYEPDGAPAGMAVVLTYASALFDRSTAAATLDRYVRVLRTIVADPRIVIGDIDLLDAAERSLALEARNDTASPVDSSATLVSLFDAAVAAGPERTAVVFGDERWTYRRFDAQVNRLARHLISLGIGPEDSVALAFPRSVDLLGAMYAVVKAGAAYVPVDPAQPASRTDHILRTADVAAVLTSSATEFTTEVLCPVVAVDGLDLDRCANTTITDVDRLSPLRPSNTAYVIFTSGSTGTPKGVAVEHRSVVNQLEWLRHEYQLSASDAAVLKTPVTFDLSVWELWSMLTVGGRLVVAEPERHREPEYLNALMAAESVTTLHVVPSMLAALVAGEADGLPSTVQRALVIGEAFPPRTASAAARGHDLRLDNLYGPTEAAVSVTRHTVTESSEENGSIPIGLPEWNTQVFVLDARLSPVPDGVVGELYLAGVQLARGYRGRGDLTAERFVANPYSADGSRMYRTGDLVRWVAGELDYVGRVDHQVKVRGFRIELGDIEAALRAVDGISDVVVVDHVDRHMGTTLVGYVVGDVEPASVKKALSHELPSYMVPSSILVLDTIPLTVNGKVDRAALPAPVFETTAYRAPTTPVEETVAAIIGDVLGTDRVGADDDFFALGGNSLLATQVVARLGAALDTQVPVRAIFEDPTVAVLAARVEEHAGSGAAIPLVPADRPDVVPLSLAQRRMWFLNRLNPESTTENIPVAVRLSGSLDLEALAAAVHDVITRHEVLRTVYPEIDGVGTQSVLGADEVHVDLEPRRIAEDALASEVVAVVGAAFDVQSQVPLRTRVLRVADDEHVLVLVTHHIAADGSSMAPLARDVMIAYAARAEGAEPTWPPLPVQYADFALWQHRVLGDSNDPESVGAVQERFWRDELHGLPEQLELPTDRPRPRTASGLGASVTVDVASELHTRIRRFAREHRATPFMVVHGALAVLLSRLSATADIAIGTPTAGRGDAALDDLVGMFVNTLVLRTPIDPAASFDSVLADVARIDLAAFGHADVPFERVVEVVDPPRSQGRHPLVQVLLAFQNTPRTTFELPGLTVSAVDIGTTTAKMDLQVTVVEQFSADGSNNGYSIAFTYATDLFDESTVAGFAAGLVRVLEAVTSGSDASVGDIDLLDSSEQQRILLSWNDTARVLDAGATVLDAFDAQVAARPDATAVVFEGTALSFAEFDARVNRLARYLILVGVGPERTVAVAMRRSTSMLVALYAVLRSGAAYVPVDPDQPAERNKYILDTAGVSVVLSTSRDEVAFEHVAVDRLPLEGFSAGPVTDVDRVRPLRASNAAYVLFTSGSTGRPKGVAVSHAAVVNQVSWLVAEYGLGSDDVVLQKTPFTFDVSVWELFGTLAAGGTLVVAEPDGHRDPEYLGSVIESEGVTATSFVPSMLSVFLAQVDSSRLQSLRHVLVAGEAFPAAVADAVRMALPAAGVHNLYGPTEFAVHATAYTLRAGDVVPSGVPMGRPVWNCAVYVLDSRLHPVPVGVVGELYLSGVQLARGYFGRADLTADRFVASPVGNGERLYRTGDLVRWTADGVLAYVGRSDFQVKLRGQRIELGEIDAALDRLPSVARATVAVRSDRLVAYVVPAGEAIDVDVVKASVAEVLPSYMVPSVFVVLDELPVGASGKLDRKALPEPVFEVREFRAPQTPVEEIVADVFADLLGAPRVGVDDDFFELGGNSLIATQALSRIGAALGRRIPVRVMFEASSVEALAARAETLAGEERAPLVSRPMPARVPLSLAQQRMWFLNRLDPDSATDNIPVAVRLRGDLDVAALRVAVTDVLARHDILRTVYPDVDGVGYQHVLSVADVEVDLEPRGVTEDDVLGSAFELFARGFDVTTEPPVRTRLLRVEDDDHVLLVVVHHIAADGFSVGPLTRDIMIAYSARVNGGVPAWTPLPVQYADYTLWQRDVLGSEDDARSLLSRQQSYWVDQLADLPEQLDIPTSRPRPRAASGLGAMHTFSIGADLRAGIDTIAGDQRATPFMVVHAALAVVLSRLAGTSDVAIGTPVAGRGDVALDDLIGMFVNTLVLRSRVDAGSRFTDILAAVRHGDIEAFEHADIPFERLVEVLDPPRSQGRHPLVQVLLAFQNIGAGTFELPGLTISGVEFDATVAKMDLQLTVSDSVDAGGASAYRVDVTYATDLFDASAIEDLGTRLLSVLGAITTDVDVVVGDIDLVDEAERETLLASSVGAVVDIDSDATVLDAFARRVAERPDAVAVRFGDSSWTYAEFDARVTAIASGLRAAGVEVGSTVAVAMRRSNDMLAALYGVIRAGAAYVPIDPDHPVERREYILDLVRPNLVLTEEVLGSLASDGATLPLPNRDDAAYVIFTSGSTGRPKGVTVSHAAVVNQVSWLVDEYGLGSDDVVLQKTPFTFDVSVWELFGTLAAGGTLVVAEPDGHRDPQYLGSVIESEGVTATSFVPSMLAAFASQVSPAAVRSLRHVLVAGEAFGSSVANAARQVMPSAQLHNLYGPTEFTVHATAYSLDGNATASDVPIGTAVSNSAAYVLDSRLHLAPVGVVGELYLAGMQLAQGYFGRADLTADRFVASPFSAGERMYRTGDLVRWDASGRLLYVGRSDFQVKLRGQRIELGEIEAAVAQCDSVSRAVADIRGDQLVAYVVPAGEMIDVDVVKASVAEVLPSYMVPSVFVVLDELPVGASGKLDRKALPEPVFEVREFRAPQTPVQEIVADVFADLLGAPRVGVDDDFFELGGNSLIATQVVARLGAALDTRVPVRMLFDASSVGDLAARVESSVGAGGRQQLVARERPEHVLLSLAQQRMWFLNRLDPQSAVYNVPMAVRLVGEMNVDALKGAVLDVVGRHEALRTYYPTVDGTPVQRVVSVDEVALDLNPIAVSETGLLEVVSDTVGRGFDVASAVPLRAALIEVGRNDRVLVVVVHHISADGSSIAPLARDVMTAYAARSVGQEPDWVPLPIQYADYALWQRDILGELDDPASIARRQLDYWRGHLADLPEVLDLPTDRPRPAVQSLAGASTTFEIDRSVHMALDALARRCGATRFMVVHAVLAALLARWAGSSDISIGTPVAGRGDAALDDLIGMFVNTLVLRTQVASAASFDELVESVRRTDIEAFGHADLPFEWLVDELSPARSTAHSPLFQVLLVFQNFAREHFELGGLTVSGVDADTRTAKYDLQFSFVEKFDTAGSVDGVAVSIMYATALFDDTTIDAVGRRFVRMLTAAVSTPNMVVGDIDVLDSVERCDIVDRWNATDQWIDPATHLVELFDRQVRRTPDAVAVVEGDRSWTYSEFDAVVNSTARQLMSMGAQPEVTVAVAMARSFDALVAVYAVMKAGAAYVPVDPEQPMERNERIISVAGPAIVLTRRCDDFIPSDDGSRTTYFEDLDCSSQPNSTVTDMDRARPLRATDAAYLIFTSGSTGLPKGMEITHAATVNQLSWAQAHYPLDETDVVLHKTPTTFDISVWEMFWTLHTGARIVVAEPGGHRDPEYLREVIQRCGVTTIHFVPSMLVAYSHAAGALGSSIRRVFVAGEALTPSTIELFRANNDADLHNWYGPAEVQVVTASRADNTDGPVSIGAPVWNTKLRVLDARLQPVPVGVSGELYVSGMQLARGYRRRPGLTADRFVADPFGAGSRMYRTGDLVQWTRDGELIYKGRTDFQVKLRGQRIEPGEIEAVLTRHPDIESAAVVLHRDATLGDRLVAYVASSTDISPADVTTFVSEAVPSYMVPSAVIVMDVLPLGATGKIDRKALPEPEFAATEYRAPVTDTELAVADIFGAVIGAEKIGLDDDFFALGGNSLIATQVVARASERFDRQVPLRLLFEASTVGSFAAKVETLVDSCRRSAPVPRSRPDRIPLSLAQQRLWVLNRLYPDSGVRNIPVAVRLSGPLNEDALRASVRDLLARHESLRTMYPEADGVGYQLICDVDDIVLDLTPAVVDEANLRATVEDIATRGFDVSSEVPLRTGLLRIADDDHVLVFVAHHIAADGFSMRPLTADVMVSYAARSEGRSPDRPPLAVQYADYTLWQRDVLGVPEDPQSLAARQLDYWRKQLDGLSEGIDLPFDRPKSGPASYSGATVTFAVSSNLRARAEALARANNATLFMVFHAALAVLLGRLAATEDVAISSPTAGRGAAELDDLIGMFVNSMVLRTRATSSTTFAEMLAHTRDIDLDAFAHSDVPFERVLEEIDSERRWINGARVPVALSFQNLGWGTLELSGLRVDTVDFDPGSAKYDLHFVVQEATDTEGRPGLIGSITYATDLFDGSTVREIGEQWIRVLEEGTSDPSVAVGDIGLVSATELSRTISEWNDTTTVVPFVHTLPELLDRQATRTPDAVAVVEGDALLTYGEFAATVARTARWLISCGVGPEDRVAVAMHRSMDLVVAVHAITVAGGAYVPMDPDQPSIRTEHVVATSNPVMVLSEIDGDTTAAFPSDPVTDSDRIRPLRSDNTAYVMFTSGSTGRPKGVAVSHAAVVNQVSWLAAEYGIDADDVVLHKTPFTFDVSVWELFGATAGGARLVIAAHDGHRDPQYLASTIESEGVTAVSFVPSMLSVFAAQVNPARLHSLRHVLAAGEELGRAAARTASASLPSATLHNLYGPTECAVHATAHRYDPSESSPTGPGEGVPIGSPVWNCGAYVLNSRLQPSPVGVVGELYLAGVQVARGYENRPDLTAERFVAHPFRTTGERLYRTGDLVRRTRSGQLVYVARVDSQVKLRGQRVELGEIETVLLQHDSVGGAAVDVRGDRLVGYVTPAGPGTDVARDAVRTLMKETLPKHMVPAVLIVVDAIPTTATGKLDRAALPDPVVSVAERRAPTTRVEEAVATVFADVMNLPQVGLDDDFFELGGNSLLATKVVSRLGDALDASVPLRLLFDASSVAELASALDEYVGDGRRLPLIGRPRPDMIPLSVQQQRTWSLAQWIPKSPYFNIPVAVRITGAIDADALAVAARDVVERHESLRTVYPEVDDVPVQDILPAEAVSLDLSPIDVTEDDLPDRMAGLLAVGFDTGCEPPIRMTLFRLGASEHVVVVVFHHIAADGSSFGPFARDLTQAYSARAAGEVPGWEPLKVQYADYALWQRERLGELSDPASLASRQLQFWRETLADQPDLLNVELDRPRPEVRTMAGSSVSVALDRDVHAAIDRCARAAGTTRFMVVHAAMAVVLARWSGNTDVTVGAPTAGRGNELLDGLVGMFVSTVVLRTVVDTSMSFAELLSDVRSRDIAAFENTDIPFDWLLNELLPARPVSQVPFFQVMMAFQNYEQRVAELGGVTMEAMGTDVDTAKLDLHFVFVEATEPDGSCAGMSIEIAYATELFDESTVVALGHALRRVLTAAVFDPTSTVGDLPMEEAVGSVHLTNTDR